MAKLFQIYEDDLADLERLLPQLAWASLPTLDNRQRAQLRRIQLILSNVRWNYGPPSQIDLIPPDDIPTQEA